MHAYPTLDLRPADVAVRFALKPRWIALWAGIAAVAAIAWLLPEANQSLGILALGCFFGVTLFLTRFEFAGAYRDLLVHRQSGGMIAQLLMAGAATVLFASALSTGEIFGQPVTGAYAPAGIAVAAGAALFGLGMQLSGGCGSGTLFALGGGKVRMLVVLLFLCAGSFAASLHEHLWYSLPSFGTVVLGERIGWGAASIVQVAAIGLAIFALARWGVSGPWHLLPRGSRWWRGPWPLAFGALLLAGLNLATLALAGHPWSITWAFALWGAKVATVLGWEPAASPFWMSGLPAHALAAPLLADTTTVMNFGIVIGALLASGWAGRFAPRSGLTARNLLSATLGGTAMGYGAGIAFGCNIGAFFSGVASTSLHGWLWMVAALAGSAVGIKLKALIDPEERGSRRPQATSASSTSCSTAV